MILCTFQQNVCHQTFDFEIKIFSQFISIFFWWILVFFNTLLQVASFMNFQKAMTLKWEMLTLFMLSTGIIVFSFTWMLMCEFNAHIQVSKPAELKEKKMNEMWMVELACSASCFFFYLYFKFTIKDTTVAF